jgi:hypothetical protein
MQNTNETLKRLLGEVFDQSREIDNPATHAQQRADFVFHMTDWQEDLERLVQLYREPGRFPLEQARDIVAALLYHATGHLIAAARLYDYVPDPFAARDAGRTAAPAAHSGRSKV